MEQGAGGSGACAGQLLTSQSAAGQIKMTFAKSTNHEEDLGNIHQLLEQTSRI
jgi:hypothetical protein